jgi:hypothetical protein
MQKFNTQRQLSNYKNKHTHEVNINELRNNILYTIALADVDTREKYLEWVEAWKKTNVDLVKLIKAYKKKRQNLSNDSASTEGILAEARYLAQSFYAQRYRMKIMSILNQADDLEV